jgi:hypothetical protein
MNMKKYTIFIIPMFLFLLTICCENLHYDAINETENKLKFAAQTKILASDAADNDYFGHSVAISGDYAIVGAYLEETGGAIAGAAYIFHRTAANTWDAGIKIVASDAQASDCFGLSVSISADYAIVGAYREDTGGADAGAAYIFHRTATNTWDAGIKIVAYDAQANDYFGYSAAISGDYAIVGAFSEDGSGTNRGAAYIFHRTGANTWDAGTKITASDTADNDYLGWSVSISGDYAIVGAADEDGSGTDRGAAYIFHRTGANTWDAGTKITASADAADNDYFGHSVSISGDYAIIGANMEDGNGTDRGAAYIFHRTGANTWDAGTKITATDAADYDHFGYSVSISGDYAIVGAADEDGSGTDRGSAYIFHRTGTNTWDADTKITASDAADNDYFGHSVSISDDYAIVGAAREDGSGTDRGAAYIFY